MQNFITIQEAAELLDVSKRTVRKRTKRNGWKTRLRDVRGDGYSTRKRVIAHDDVLAEKQPEARPEQTERSIQNENLPDASQVRSTFRALR